MSEDDELLQALHVMPISWFSHLTKVLAASYSHLYREFIRPDGQLIYSVCLHKHWLHSRFSLKMLKKAGIYYMRYYFILENLPTEI